MQNDNDILKYLSAYKSDRLMETSALSLNIKQIHNDLSNTDKGDPDPTKLQELNQMRLLSSNTLSKFPKQQKIAAWNNAQGVLFQLLSEKNQLSNDDFKTLNTAITGSKSNGFRDFEIQTGAGEYLSSDKVSEAFKTYANTLETFKNDPLRTAFETYLTIVTVHPFENGNGRTARLAADFYLLGHGHLPVCFKSSIQSHVALVKNSVKRSKEESYLKFLEAVKYSHHIVYGSFKL